MSNSISLLLFFFSAILITFTYNSLFALPIQITHHRLPSNSLQLIKFKFVLILSSSQSSSFIYRRTQFLFDTLIVHNEFVISTNRKYNVNASIKYELNRLSTGYSSLVVVTFSSILFVFLLVCVFCN